MDSIQIQNQRNHYLFERHFGLLEGKPKNMLMNVLILVLIQWAIICLNHLVVSSDKANHLLLSALVLILSTPVSKISVTTSVAIEISLVLVIPVLTIIEISLGVTIEIVLTVIVEITLSISEELSASAIVIKTAPVVTGIIVIDKIFVCTCFSRLTTRYVVLCYELCDYIPRRFKL